MNTYQFKTSLSCEGCVNKIEKILNAEKEINHWQVDLSSADKTLSIQTESFDPALIPALLLKAGYKASQI